MKKKVGKVTASYYPDMTGDYIYMPQEKIVDMLSDKKGRLKKHSEGRVFYKKEGNKIVFTSVIKNGRKYISLHRFTEGLDKNKWSDLMDGCNKSGISPIGSYGKIFRAWHDKKYGRKNSPFFTSPETVEGIGRVDGGWEYGKEGYHRKALGFYDINRAYRWSATRGLPDMRSIRSIDSIPDVGIYFAVGKWDKIPPYQAMQGDGFYPAIQEEVNYFGGFNPERIVTFDKTVSLDPFFEWIDRNFVERDSKQAGRAFWGIWLSSDSTAFYFRNLSTGKETKMGNYFASPIAAYILMTRIKVLIASYNPVHVFVDSMITEEEPANIGKKVGEFKIVANYPKGIYVHRAGFFMDLKTGIWERHTSVTTSGLSKYLKSKGLDKIGKEGHNEDQQ